MQENFKIFTYAIIVFYKKHLSHMTKFILPFWVIMHPNQDQIPGIQFLFFFNFLLLLFFLLYNIVLVLPYINMHPPWVYTCSPSGTPLPPPSPYHPSGSSQCTSPKLPVSCIEPAWTGDSFLIWYYTCFNAILPNHPPPPCLQTVNAGDSETEKRESSYTVGRNVNWYRHYGEQYRSSLKT